MIIPEGVTYISGSCFDTCYNLEELTLPESLTSIAKEAFVGSYIKELTIQAAVTEIGENAFPDSMSLHVHAGSYAEEYAKENGLTYDIVE